MLFNVVNLGCKVNRVESDAVAAMLIARGWKESALEAADFIVVNTCTVTGEAEKKTRKAVRHALAINDFAPVLVTGCASAISPEIFEALDARVKVISKAALYLEVSAYAEKLDGATGANTFAIPIGTGFHTRVGVKIQDGCNHACTYCIVHVARGKSSSKDAKDVIDECVRLAENGVKEIVLSGINIGCYRGEYEGKNLRLAGLLRILLEKTAHQNTSDGFPLRFRIGSIEPCDVDEELISLLAEADGRIARHLHLPLQSGSTRVLREMARPYTAHDFSALVENLRKQVPSIALSTDIIVGFPGETDEDFAETVAVAKRSRFMKIHVFPYSRREGTPASERPDQIDPSVKSARAATLRRLSDELAALDLSSRANTIELALVEGEGRATLESYHEVSVSQDVLPGSLLPFEL